VPVRVPSGKQEQQDHYGAWVIMEIGPFTEKSWEESEEGTRKQRKDLN
jgi:hypothetical protein